MPSAAFSFFALPLAALSLSDAGVPATAPATGPADPLAATWAAACRALDAQDLPTFRACFYNKNELAKLFLNAYSETTVATFQLAKSAARLGKEGQDLAWKLQAVQRDLAASAEGRSTVMVGDSARWTRLEKTPQGNAEQVMYFRNIDGKWLIDTEKSYGLEGPAGRAAAEAYLAQTAKELPALKAVLRDLDAGKIATFKDMQKRLEAP